MRNDTPRIDRDADSLLAIVPLQGLSESRYLRNGEDLENDCADYYPSDARGLAPRLMG